MDVASKRVGRGEGSFWSSEWDDSIAVDALNGAICELFGTLGDITWHVRWEVVDNDSNSIFRERLHETTRLCFFRLNIRNVCDWA